MERSKRILGLGAAAVIALLAMTFFMADNLTSTTDAAEGGPEMALTVSEGGTCEGSTCTVEPGAAFTLSVEVLTAPAEGYILAQSYVVFGSDLTYKPTDLPLDEFSFPECSPASIALRDQLDPESVLSGCITGILVRPVSTYTGNFLNYSMNCSAGDSSTLVQLLPEGDPIALTNGALFKDPGDNPIIPKVSNITIVCGAGGGDPTDTPDVPDETPTNTPDDVPVDTPTNTPTNTPVPPTSTPSEQQCGDVNDNEAVDAVDALLILQVEAGLIDGADRLPKGDQADVNGDGNVDSRDAALIQQVVAGLLDQDRLTC